MQCPQCGRDSRVGAAFCDGCGSPLAQPAAPNELFVGRDEELRRLHAALTGTRAGSGRLVLVGGDPGIGKSRLLQEAATRANRLGFLVLWGRCLEDPSAPPYWPWLQLMRDWLRGADEGQVARCVNADAGLLLDLLPELSQRLVKIQRLVPIGAPSEARFRLFEAIARVLQRIAREQPLALIFDNLHAADSVSLRLLEFLGPELADVPLLIIGSYRPTGVSRSDPFAHTLSELARQPQSERLSLTGLHPIETRELVRALTVHTPLPMHWIASIQEHSEGNPLFVRELTQALAPAGASGTGGHVSREGLGIPIPEGIRGVLRGRAQHLSARCQALIRAAAVIGRSFELELLVAVSDDLDTAAVLESLDEALAGKLIEALPEPGHYQFSHALIRDTLYDELPASQRLQLHLRIGEKLAKQRDSVSAALLSQLAYHFGQAAPLGTAERAIAYAAQAGGLADRLLAYEEAARLYTLALQLHSRYGATDTAEKCRLLLALGTAQYKAGEYAQAMSTFRRAAANARQRHAAEDLARAALGYEEANWRPGLPGSTACQLLRDALSAIGPEQPALKVRLLGALTRALIFTGDVERAEAVQSQAVTLARHLGEPDLLAAALRAGLSARWRPERLRQRLEDAREVTALAEQAGDWDTLFEGLSWQLFDLLEAADMPAARTTLDYHSRLAQELRQPFYRYIGVSFRAVLALMEGRFDSSERYAREALALGQRQGLDAFGVFSLQMFSIERERGRLDQLAPVLERFLAQSESGHVWRPGLALLYCELGRLEDARAEFERLGADRFAAVPRDGLWITSLSYLAEVCAALGSAEHAGLLYELISPYAGRNVVAGTTVACYGSADRFLGLLAAVRGEPQAAARHFEAALRLDAETGARTWLAHTRYHYAALQLAGDPPGGRAKGASLLTDARTIVDELGMTGLRGKIDALSRRARLEVDKTAAPDGLSRRELAVLRLLAAGHSNREIGERLFVSPNTVANHVRNILAKTGTANRTEAAAYAHRRGLAGG